MLFLKLMKAF